MKRKAIYILAILVLLLQENPSTAQAQSANPGISQKIYLTSPADFPVVNINVPAANTDSGYIFASNWRWASPNQGSYLLILDNKGEPVFYQKLLLTDRALDFKVLPDGTLSYFDDSSGYFYILDNTYNTIKVIKPGNGYLKADAHDLVLLPNGHYLYLIYENYTIDMSKIVPGGNPQATVTGSVIQEQDSNQNIVFEWKSIDHIPITDTNQSMTTAYIDYIHSNALEIDADGNILLSSRHLDEITKIDRLTGNILWRWGGKANQFTFINDPVRFHYQHHIRRLPNGHFTIFDNHDGQTPQISRAIEYILDENAKTATLFWQYQNPLNTYSLAMGDAQRLPNGNTFIGWGSNSSPAITEVQPDGTKVFEMSFDAPNVSYRAFRYPWHGYPTWPPALVLQNTNNGLTAAFSWNGATEVASYKVYGGSTINPTNLITDTLKTGFEDSVLLKGSDGLYCYYQVIPIDNQGKAGAASMTVQNQVCKMQVYLPLIGSAH